MRLSQICVKIVFIKQFGKQGDYTIRSCIILIFCKHNILPTVSIFSFGSQG